MPEDPGRLSRYPWLAPAALAGFLDGLKSARFDIDTGRRIAVQDAVLALVARGVDLSRPEALIPLLGPLVCSSGREQTEFRRHFEIWIENRGWARPAPESPPAIAAGQELERELRRGVTAWRRRIIFLGLLFGLMAVVFAVAWDALVTRMDFVGGFALVWDMLVGKTDPIGPAENLSSQERRELVRTLTAAALIQILALTAAFALASWLVWRLGWRHRAKLFLERREAPDTPALEKLPVAGTAAGLFDGIPLARAAQRLRRRVQIPSPDLDLDATVDATAEAGGWFTPVYGVRRVIPEYLVLVDRTGPGDQQAGLMDALLDRLASRDVFVTRYHFDGDPRLCFPVRGKGPPLSLAELAAQYSGHRLLLLSDGARLLDPATGRMEAWVEQLAAWGERALFTFQPEPSWGHRETALGARLLVVPANVEGFHRLAHRLGGGKPEPVTQAAVHAPVPETLVRRPLRWIDRLPPPAAETDAMLAELRRHLGEDGWYWLCALAVYPALDSQLTLHLGQTLKDAAGQPLLDWPRLALLARLPWLRHGAMPEWLRRRLVGSLGRDQARSVRQSLDALLLSALDTQPDSAFYLEIARKRPASFEALARAILRRWAKDREGEGPLRDYVFLAFMAGRRLALPVPEALRRLFARPAEIPDWLVEEVRKDRRWAWGVLAIVGLLLLWGLLWDAAVLPLSGNYRDALVLSTLGLNGGAAMLPYAFGRYSRAILFAECVLVVLLKKADLNISAYLWSQVLLVLLSVGALLGPSSPRTEDPAYLLRRQWVVVLAWAWIALASSALAVSGNSPKLVIAVTVASMTTCGGGAAILGFRHRRLWPMVAGAFHFGWALVLLVSDIGQTIYLETLYLGQEAFLRVFFIALAAATVLDGLALWSMGSLDFFGKLAARLKLRWRPAAEADQISESTGKTAPEPGPETAADELRSDDSRSPGEADAQAYYQMGSAAEAQGLYGAAATAYRKALKIYEELSYRPGIAGSCRPLGRVAQKQGDYAAALDWYRKALVIFEELGDWMGVAGCYEQLSKVAEETGDRAAALEWHRSSLAIHEELGDQPGQGTSRSTIYLSYVREDSDAAQRLRRHLEEMGYEVLPALSMPLGAGEPWDRQIETQINACDLFMPLLSRQVVRREQSPVYREWTLAMERQKQMSRNRIFTLPAAIDGISPMESSFPTPFDDLQWARAPDGNPDENLLDQLQSLARSLWRERAQYRRGARETHSPRPK